jgi:hypothetical protein
VYAIDPRAKEKSALTARIGPEGVGDVVEGRVFGQNKDLAVDFAVPGDADISLTVQLFDEEMIKNAPKAEAEINKNVQAGVIAGVGVITAINPAIGAVAAGVLAVAKAIGVLDEIGGLIVDMFGDDHLGTLDLRITKEFLKTLKDNPKSLDRTSDSIGGETYNFPQLPEDGSEAGHSWMFRQEGKGTYRPFFRVVLTEP